MAAQSPPGDDSPLRQGAGGDLLNPPRWDWRRRHLWKVFRIVALDTGVIIDEGFLQSERQVQGRREGPTHQVGATRAWAAPPQHLAASSPHFVSPPVFWKLRGKIRSWALISSNSENISLLGFLKPKTAENRNWHFGILLIGQFQKMHEYDIKCA